MKLTTSSIILSLSMLLLPTAFAGSQKKPGGKNLNHKEDNNVSPPSTTKLDFDITVYRSVEGAYHTCTPEEISSAVKKLDFYVEHWMNEYFHEFGIDADAACSLQTK